MRPGKRNHPMFLLLPNNTLPGMLENVSYHVNDKEEIIVIFRYVGLKNVTACSNAFIFGQRKSRVTANG